MNLEDAFTQNAVRLACAIVIVFFIVLTGRLIETMPHAGYPTESRAMGEGFVWCFNGAFGNGCFK